MHKNGAKKVLVLTDISQNLEDLVGRKQNIDLENTIILYKYETILQPFGDLMRDIMITVYQENIEEIVVIGTKKVQKKSVDLRHIMAMNQVLIEKVKTLDYLFANCMPEFPEGNIFQWLEGNKEADDLIQTVNVIRHHPLMPTQIKIRPLWLEDENEDYGEKTAL